MIDERDRVNSEKRKHDRGTMLKERNSKVDRGFYSLPSAWLNSGLLLPQVYPYDSQDLSINYVKTQEKRKISKINGRSGICLK